MKNLVLVLVILNTPALFAGLPIFEKPISVKVGGEIIKTESPHYASPAIVDLDNDGLVDLALMFHKSSLRQA